MLVLQGVWNVFASSKVVLYNGGLDLDIVAKGADEVVVVERGSHDHLFTFQSEQGKDHMMLSCTTAACTVSRPPNDKIYELAPRILVQAR
jgi:hypothetical protein